MAKLQFFRVNDPIRVTKSKFWFFYIKIYVMYKYFENIKKSKGENPFLFLLSKHLFLGVCMNCADCTEF